MHLTMIRKSNMIVTDIVQLSGKRYKIFIDGEFAFVLYKGELRPLRINIGEELPEETYDTIVSEIIPKRAKLRAMHLLEKRPYSEFGIRTKLQENLYDEAVIDQTVEYLKGFGYIDDKAFAVLYLETYTGSKSLKRMIADLRAKGISVDNIDKAVEQCRGTDELEDERVLIRKLLDKRGFDPETATERDIAKLVTYLYGKGFSPDLIRDEMRAGINDGFDI